MRRNIFILKAAWTPKRPFTGHAIVHLIDQIYESFENDNYTLGVFIDLSKAFDNVDHSILLKKLEMYGVDTTNLAWFASHLNGRKQYLKIAESADTVKKDIKCGVPQGSTLGPLLFLLYANYLLILQICLFQLCSQTISKESLDIGVSLGDNVSWKEHIKYLENKIAKNIGLINWARHF